MPERNLSPKPMPVAAIEDALVHLVVAGRLLRQARLSLDDGRLGEKAARRAYRRTLEALDRAESLNLSLKELAPELEAEANLDLPVR